MENIKKIIMFFGAVAIALMMVSTVTAAPEVYGKPVMDQAEKNEELQNINTYDLYKLNDMEGFMNHITSDWFLSLLNWSYNTIAEDSLFQEYYNSDGVQALLEDEGFLEFANSDEVQYILDNFNPSTEAQQGQTLQSIVYELTRMESQTLNTEQGVLGITGNQIEGTASTQSRTVTSNEWVPGQILFMVLLILFVGVVTWIPAAVIGILYIPVVWFAIWLSLPGFIDILSFPAVLLFTIIVYVIVVIFWPLIWWLVWMAMNPINPFPQFP